MKNLKGLFASALVSFALFLQAQKDPPKIVVGIVVDQMRYDYLQRYYNDFGEGGFKKLMNQGFSAENLHYHYKPTYTGPGHASIFTGAPPAKHGIVGNNWYSREEEKVVYCAESLKKGGGYWMSPQRLKGRTISDEMKLFFGKKAKVFGVSLKDRGAILPVGHLADGAYWFDGDLGKWISSDYYQTPNPDWLNSFNQQDFLELYLSKAWDLSLEEKDYSESNADQTNYENELFQGSGVSFPYNLLEAYREKGWGVLKSIPQGNRMTTDLTLKVIEANQLGVDDIPDFLSVSYSATDYVGHRFGVGSRELHDTYVKLDQDLERLIAHLEKTIGKDNFILFLTSDHGAGEVRNHLKELGAPNGRLRTKQIKEQLDSALDANFGPMNWISSLINLNIYFNPEVFENDIVDRESIFAFATAWLAEQDGIQQVWNVQTGTNTFQYSEIIERGYNKQESGDLILLEKAAWSNYSDKGSTHGSPYQYDTHVPFLLYGKNLDRSTSTKAYTIANIAPTVAYLMGVPAPDLAINKLIQEALK
ncbi:MAG: alkaline phosphatase family protein [Vicingaceae bacterium]